MRAEFLTAQHFNDLPVARLPEHVRADYSRHYLGLLQQAGPAFALRCGERVMLLGGAAFDDLARPWLWSFIAIDAGPHMLSLTRAVRRFISTFEGTVFATADKRDICALRWMRLLRMSPSRDPAWPPGPDLLFERA